MCVVLALALHHRADSRVLLDVNENLLENSVKSVTFVSESLRAFLPGEGPNGNG